MPVLSLLVFPDDAAIVVDAEVLPGLQIDVVAGEPDGTVCHQQMHATNMFAPSRVDQQFVRVIRKGWGAGRYDG